MSTNRAKVVAITQARMTSTRLPRKVMLEVCGKTLLQHHIERVQRAKTVDEVVVATTVNAADDAIASLCAKLDVRCVRGDEADVLSRYVLAAREAAADVVVRVTSDCPLIDPDVTDRTIQAFVDRMPAIDYASNRLVHTYPRGLDTEVLGRAVLDAAGSEATRPDDREHVTLFVWRQPTRYRLHNVANDSDLSRLRWTVDTPEDFELIRRMFETLYPINPRFGLAECLQMLAVHPEWERINAHVQQKMPQL